MLRYKKWLQAVMMSISERERQVLDSIESELAHSDQRLASMLVMFTRLTADEQMPGREPVRTVAREPGGPAATARQEGARLVWRCHIGPTARRWLWLAALAAALALMVTLTHGNRVSPCAHSLATAACKAVPVGLPAGPLESGR